MTKLSLSISSLVLALFIRLISAQRGLPRTITVVSDYVLEDGIPYPLAPRPRYPSHSWLLIGPTEDEWPLRVELVVPTSITNKPLGLAIAVTEYSSSRIDLGRSDFPRVKGTSRRSRNLTHHTTTTNRHWFSPFPDRSSQDDGLPLSIIQNVWLGGLRSSGVVSFASSHEFVVRVLRSPLLHYTGDDLAETLREVVWEGEQWSIIKRQHSRGVRDSRAFISRVKQLFWEAPQSLNPLAGLGQQRPQTLRMLFAADKNYGPVRVDQGWQGLMIEDPRPKNQRGAAYLSRDPLLTSDVLPLEATLPRDEAASSTETAVSSSASDSGG